VNRWWDTSALPRVGPILTRTQIHAAGTHTQPTIWRVADAAAHIVYIRRSQLQNVRKIATEASDRLRRASWWLWILIPDLTLEAVKSGFAGLRRSFLGPGGQKAFGNCGRESNGLDEWGVFALAEGLSLPARETSVEPKTSCSSEFRLFTSGCFVRSNELSFSSMSGSRALLVFANNSQTRKSEDAIVWQLVSAEVAARCTRGALGHFSACADRCCGCECGSCLRAVGRVYFANW